MGRDDMGTTPGRCQTAAETRFRTHTTPLVPALLQARRATGAPSGCLVNGPSQVAAPRSRGNCLDNAIGSKRNNPAGCVEHSAGSRSSVQIHPWGALSGRPVEKGRCLDFPTRPSSTNNRAVGSLRKGRSGLSCPDRRKAGARRITTRRRFGEIVQKVTAIPPTRDGSGPWNPWLMVA